MDPGAANAIAGQERAKLAHGQRSLFCMVAEGQRFPRDILHEFMANRITQLVGAFGIDEVGIGVAGTAALQRQDFQAGGRQLLGQNAARPAIANKQDVDRFELRGHGRISRDFLASGRFAIGSRQQAVGNSQ